MAKGKEDSQEGDYRSFDPCEIEFPTDKLRVKDLIERYPGSFQWDWLEFCQPDSPPKAFQDLFEAMHVERELASIAFNQALGASQPREKASASSDHLASSREDLIHELSVVYNKLGLASGPMQTTELVTRFEKSAFQQAASGRGF